MEPVLTATQAVSAAEAIEQAALEVKPLLTEAQLKSINGVLKRLRRKALNLNGSPLVTPGARPQ